MDEAGVGIGGESGLDRLEVEEFRGEGRRGSEERGGEAGGD